MRTSGFLPKFRGKTSYFQLAFVHHLLFFYRDLEVSGRQWGISEGSGGFILLLVWAPCFCFDFLGSRSCSRASVSFPCSLPASPIKTHWRYEGLFSVALYNLKYVGVSVWLENAGAAARNANQCPSLPLLCSGCGIRVCFASIQE